VNGPSWSRKKRIKITTADSYKNPDKKNGDLQDPVSEGNVIEAAKNSVRANMLVRAYRIRGHLIANLDPLGLQEREEHSELKTETYGFLNKDLNKKIFLDGILGIQIGLL
jgi:2-oxoglutarate dehydrogenase complex, dehydrogenase (E1) component, and related enzymes